MKEQTMMKIIMASPVSNDFAIFPWIVQQVTGKVANWEETLRNISLNSNFTANIERTETRLTRPAWQSGIVVRLQPKPLNKSYYF